MKYDNIFKNLKLAIGSIAGKESQNVLDSKDHFPVFTEDQATSSVSRVIYLQEAPNWYKGTLDELRYEVYAGASEAHPNLQFKVKIPSDWVAGLSDGESDSDTKKSDIKNPADIVETKVSPATRPSIAQAVHYLITAANQDKQSIAESILDMIKKKEEHLKKSKELAEKLLNSGLSGDEFQKLAEFLQHDILFDLLNKEVASTQREKLFQQVIRQRMSGQDNAFREPRKPTDGCPAGQQKDPKTGKCIKQKGY